MGRRMLELYQEAGAPEAEVLAADLKAQEARNRLIYSTELGPENIMPYGTFLSTLGSNVGPHMLSQTVNYGAGFFEGMKIIRGENGKFYFVHPDDNFDRIAMGARKLGYNFNYSNEKLVYVSAMLALMNGFEKSWPLVNGKEATILYVRPLITKPWGTGIGVGGSHAAQLSIIVDPMGLYFDNAELGVDVFFYSTGVKQSFASSEHFSFKANSNYEWAGQLRIMAQSLPIKTSETVAMNDGRLKEGSSDTVAIIKGNCVICPPLSTGRLNGITMRFVESIAGELGFSVIYADLGAKEVLEADGIMLLGNAVNLLGVNRAIFRAQDLKGIQGLPEPEKEDTIPMKDIGDEVQKDTQVLTYRFKTTENPVFKKIQRAFADAWEKDAFGKLSVCIQDDIFVPDAGRILEELGHQVRETASRSESPIVEVSIPNLLREDARLTLENALFPVPRIRRVDTFWSRVLSGLRPRHQPLLTR